MDKWLKKMTPKTRKSLATWQKNRFGMFIHWGLYTVDGQDCWKMHDQGIPVAEYVERFGKRFNPRKFDADAFIDTAKSAGCKYIVMGTRHHEGYCLWDTETTDYSSVKMAPQRDFIAEYVAAARAAGIQLGFYYSVLDWRHQAYFDGPYKNPDGFKRMVKQIHTQVRELMTNYGKIDILWYDGVWPAWAWWGFKKPKDLVKAWRSRELDTMVRRLQPGILLNNRSDPPHGGDFATPEQEITPDHRPWELCDTLGQMWGDWPTDLIRKTPREVVYRLISCVGRGGNMLLNIGPTAAGTVRPWQARVMAQVGEWLERHGEAIYGCTGEWQEPFYSGLAPWRSTRKGTDTLYVHLLRYCGTEFGIGNLHDIYIRSATLLTTGQRLKVKHEATRDIISGLPAKCPDPIIAVVKLRVRRKTPAERVRPLGIGVDDPERDIDYLG